jgi:hypothetical protein
MSFRLNLTETATFGAARHTTTTIRTQATASKIVPAGFSRLGDVPAAGSAAARIAAVLGGARH